MIFYPNCSAGPDEGARFVVGEAAEAPEPPGQVEPGIVERRDGVKEAPPRRFAGSMVADQERDGQCHGGEFREHLCGRDILGPVQAGGRGAPAR